MYIISFFFLGFVSLFALSENLEEKMQNLKGKYHILDDYLHSKEHKPCQEKAQKKYEQECVIEELEDVLNEQKQIIKTIESEIYNMHDQILSGIIDSSLLYPIQDKIEIHQKRVKELENFLREHKLH